jgi:two-component system cell cycle response regulator
MTKSSKGPARAATGKETGTVLVVDDDPQTVDILRRLLEAQRFTTLTASNGPECLEIARRQPLDVILLDVVMPGMDGLQVCRELAKDPQTRAIPVILLTAKDDHETRAAGMMLGVSEFLTKPVNKHELYFRVRAQIRTRIEARQIEETLGKVR